MACFCVMQTLSLHECTSTFAATSDLLSDIYWKIKPVDEEISAKALKVSCGQLFET